MLTRSQRARAAIAIAQMAAKMIDSKEECEQHDVAYSMQEFALMLLGEANMELEPSDKSFKAANEPDGKYKVIIIAPHSTATLEINDDEVERVGMERKMKVAEWIKASAEIDLECIA
jgi:hypothetical protein